MVSLLFALLAISPEAESLLVSGIEASRFEDYAAARKAYAEAQKLAPDDPAPYFLNGALTFIYMVDFATDSLEVKFNNDLDKALKLADEGIKKNGDNARDYFFIGSVHIFRMVENGWKRNYIKAMSEGLKAIAPLKRAIELDSTLYDAYLAQGGVDYFSGSVSRYIPWAKGTKTVEKGIKEVKLVYEKGRYFKNAAGQAYSFMLKEEGRAYEALAINEEQCRKYPQSRTFRWGLGELYIDLHKYREAIGLYKKLYEDVLQSQPSCYTNIYQIKLNLAQCYHGLGKRELARKYCKEVIANKHRIRRDLGYSDIVKDAEKLLKELGD